MGSRALRALVVLAVGAVGLSGWAAPGAADPSATAHPSPADRLPPALTVQTVADPLLLRIELPRGYDTVAARAARAAVEQEVARVAAEAARAAAAEAARSRSAAASPATPARGSSAAAAVGLPLGVDPGSSTQVVTVVAPSAGSTTAMLTAWQLGADGWTAVLGPVGARVGSAGVGRASESTTRTPAGVFSLTEAFGRAGDPGTGLPYRVVDGDDWWVSDVNSPRYNQYAECARNSCDFDEAVSENLAEEAAYQYAAVIDYNRGGTPGAGSGFFLHVSNGAPTLGCVAVDAGNLVTVLRWLDPGARPLIAIGVG